jgi:hypothetical protein
MSSLLYGDYILISRPMYDEKLDVWKPYASISWDGEKFHYHQLKDLTETFTTEAEALSYGFLVAHHWINKNRPVQTS